jgi:hypothetical protein
VCRRQRPAGARGRVTGSWRFGKWRGARMEKKTGCLQWWHCGKAGWSLRSLACAKIPLNICCSISHVVLDGRLEKVNLGTGERRYMLNVHVVRLILPGQHYGVVIGSNFNRFSME